MPFNDYINVNVAYLQQGDTEKNWTRLGLLQADMTWMQDLLQHWNTLYALYIDKKGSRTTEVTNGLKSDIDKMLDYNQSQNLLDRIAASLNATTVDLDKFNIRKASRQTSKGTFRAIEEVVDPTIEPIRGGVLSIKCYSIESSRPSILSEANCVQLSYIVQTDVPQSPDDAGMIHEVSSRASFSINLGPENSGKRVHIFLRWFSTVHPESAGPWSSVISVWLS